MRFDGAAPAGVRRLLQWLQARPALAGALAMVLLVLAAHAWSIDIRASRGASITGDEPFYLLTTQSLLQDGDLDLRQQYARQSYESFFDHPDGLWRQSVPLDDGRLLSPHNPGLAVLLIPGFALGGLLGAQLQLVALSALTWALAYVLALRLVRAPLRGIPASSSLLAWLATAAVALSATAFIYGSEVYPELPAGFALVVALLLVTHGRRVGSWRALALIGALSAMPWLGVKYVPLAALVALYALWRAEGIRPRLLLAGGGVLSAVAYGWFHLAVFEGLTPYAVNVVYAGGGTGEIVGEHVEFRERIYRLWGLLIDRRFGVARWAPVLFAVLPGLVLIAARPYREWRSGEWLVLLLIGIQVLIAAFVVITMMGWWFPGRTLVTVFPLLPVPLALTLAHSGRAARGVIAALAAYSVVVTAVLARAGHARDITIAVDPFDLGSWPFQAVAGLFPQYTSWTLETWVLTVTWLAVGGLCLAWWLLGRWWRARLGPAASEAKGSVIDPADERGDRPPARAESRT